MKVLLIIFCAGMVLFAGGCTVLLGSAGGIGDGGFVGAGLVAVTVLNLLVLLALAGFMQPLKPAFYILAAVDFLLAAAVLAVAFYGLSMSDAELVPWVVMAAVVIAGKGLLTLRYARASIKEPLP